MHYYRDVATLRTSSWSEVPDLPGVYRFYFPVVSLPTLKIFEFTDASSLKLMSGPDGKVCLYQGMASCLSQRIEWHAAQKLRHSALSSGFLSTFRLTLLSLNQIDFRSGDIQINNYFDTLSIDWRIASSKSQAKEMEKAEFRSGYHYPLNIQGNPSEELASYIQHIKSTRKEYKIGNMESKNKSLT